MGRSTSAMSRSTFATLCSQVASAETRGQRAPATGSRLHQRDFNPSTPLYDSVTAARESSSQTIIMLSRAQLQTHAHLIA